MRASTPLGAWWGTCSSEWIKYRRTFTWPLVLLGPVLWEAAVASYLTLRPSSGWREVFAWTFEAWTQLFIPIGAALLAGLAASCEAQAGDWRALRTRPVAPGLLYAAKLLVLLAQTLIGTALVGGAAGVAGLAIGAPGPVPWATLALAAALAWVAALPVVSLQLWVATARGPGLSLGLGAVGLLLAAIVGGTSMGDAIWPLVPWAWPPRILAVPALQVLGGAVSEAASVRASLILRYLLAAGPGVGLLLSGAGILWFSRREVTGEPA